MPKTKDFNFEIKDKTIEFTINTKIYSLTAIYQTAYFFLDKVYVFLDGDPEKDIVVVMKIKEASADGSTMLTMTASADLEKIANEFYNELLNQLLREKVNQTNSKIREYIVAQALYSAVPSEVDELLKEVEEEDWQADPLGISKTWETANEDEDKKAGENQPAPKSKTAKKKKEN